MTAAAAAAEDLFFARPADLANHDLGDLADLANPLHLEDSADQQVPPRPPPPKLYEPSNFLSLPRPAKNPVESTALPKAGSLPRGGGLTGWKLSKSASMNQFVPNSGAPFGEAELDGMLDCSFPTPYDKFVSKSNNTLNI